jgi:hypothetical protein
MVDASRDSTTVIRWLHNDIGILAELNLSSRGEVREPARRYNTDLSLNTSHLCSLRIAVFWNRDKPGQFPELKSASWHAMGIKSRKGLHSEQAGRKKSSAECAEL